MTVRQYFTIFLFGAPLLLLALALVWPPVLLAFLVLLPVLIMGVMDMMQTKQTTNPTRISFAGVSTGKRCKRHSPFRNDLRC